VYPKALFGTLLTAGVVYVLIGMASSIALPAAELNSSSGPLLQVVEATGFGIPGRLFVVPNLALSSRVSRNSAATPASASASAAAYERKLLDSQGGAAQRNATGRAAGNGDPPYFSLVKTFLATVIALIPLGQPV
jgi:amino acid transporter